MWQIASKGMAPAVAFFKSKSILVGGLVQDKLSAILHAFAKWFLFRLSSIDSLHRRQNRGIH